VDVTPPHLFSAVAHPSDPTMLVAIVIHQTPSSNGAPIHAPHYRVWSADETYQLDGAARMISSTLEANPIGRLPGVLASTVPAMAKGRLLADDPGSDLVAAHLSVVFQNVLLLKESKSANRQNYLTGDTSAAVTGQAADTETDAQLPEGVSVQTVDRGMDLAQFRDNADHMLERAAANHGLPPSVLHHRDASSGAEIELRRIPIREIRKQQIMVMRRVERELAEVQSAINAIDRPDLAFSTEGWSIDFGEVQQPLTERERDEAFEKRRQLGLTDTVEEIMRRDPDLRTRAAAEEVLGDHIIAEESRVRTMQNLQRMNGSASTPAIPEPVE
jgi:hypothetical protein